MTAVEPIPFWTTSSATPQAVTPEEQAAFVSMQGRMIELLLRHDVRRFGLLFAERQAELEKLGDERLQEYRDLAVIFYLRDELFDNILVRIKRRLSFEAPRETQQEEWPARGRIDWSRTMQV